MKLDKEKQEILDNNSKKNEVNKKINLYPLTPRTLDDMEGYENFLDYALTTKDIKNIALTGKYGAGKSTIWKSYEELKGLEDSTINISLMGFKDENNQTNPDINKIEYQILNQILYQVDERKISKSKYRVKKASNKDKTNKLNWHMGLIIIGLIGIVFNIDYSILKNMLVYKWFGVNINKMTYLVSENNFIKILLIDIVKNIDSRKIGSIIIGVDLIFIISKYLLKRFRYLYIKQIGIKDTKIEFEKDKDKSLFDIDEDEIVYIIRESGKKIVVFEDLDRFENVEIFSKLRVINSLVNIDCGDEPIRFIYMIRNDIFISKERTKFFDLIIPIVPMINSSNSEGKVLEIFKDEVDDKNIDRVFLERISLYIDDMRLLYNIYNEYYIYRNTIDKNDRKLDLEKLLGSIVYKNIFPGDYEKLLEDKGYVFTIFDTYKNNNEYIRDLEKDIKVLEEDIEELNIMIEDNKYLLMLEYIPKDKGFFKMENDGYVDFFKEIENNPKEMYYYHTNRSVRSQIRGEEILESIEENDEYKEKERLLDNKTREDSIKNKKDELNKLKSDKKNLEGMTLKELLEKRYIDESFLSEKLKGDFSNVINDHYFPLIKFLIIDGYLDESYHEYLSYYHEGELSINDNRYIRSIYENQALDYTYKLNSSKEVLRRLKDSDFTRVNILNFNLLEYIVEKNKEYSFKLFIDMLEENQKIIFLDEYFDISEENQKNLFINSYLNYKEDGIRYWINNEAKVNKKNIFYIIDYVLVFMREELNIIEENNEIVKYIENNTDILEYQENGDIKSIIESYKKLNIRFSDLKEINIKNKMLDGLMENKLYYITLNNMNKFFEKTIKDYSVRKEYFLERQFTTINSNKKLRFVKEYVEENLEEYLDVYINGVDHEISFNNGEEDIKIILNSNINKKIKDKYLEKNRVILESLNNIPSEFFNKLIESEYIKLTYENIEIFYKQHEEINANLLKMINGVVNIDDWSKSLENKSDHDLEKYILNDDKVNFNIKSKIVNNFNSKIEELNSELNQKDIQLLIDNNKLEMNKENLKKIKIRKDKYIDINILKYIEDNIEDYILLLNENNEKSEVISKEIVYEILLSKIRDDKKEKVLELYDGDIKLSKLLDKANISSDIKTLIKSKYFDEDDIEKLIELYSLKLNKEDKKLILDILVEKNIQIKTNIILKNKTLVNDLIIKSNLEMEFKEELLLKAIDEETKIDLINDWINSIEGLEKLVRVLNENPQIVKEDSVEYRVSEILHKYNFVSIIRARTEGEFIIKKLV